MSTVELKVFFNFRSPYCYLASRSMFERFDRYDIPLAWRSLGGWDGRSPPERAKVKIPLTRQDVARWCKRLGVPFNPPPVTTDPTPAALVAFAAEQAGLLREYVVAVMWREWAEGGDIGQRDVLEAIATDIGLERAAVADALASDDHRARLRDNWAEASAIGVIGVPSFVVGDQVFWGNDRIDFLEEHLAELGLAKAS